MQLFYTDIRTADLSRAIRAAGSAREGSAWGRSLLSRAWEHCRGGEMPRVEYTAQGRPVFAGENAPFFSLSHTEGLVICAFGDVPVGADAERPRAIYPGTAEKLLLPEETAQFDFFRVWTLRESAFKLTGSGGMRSPRVFKEDGRVRCADARLHFALLELCGCPVSLCSFEPLDVWCVEIPVEQLMKA